MRNRWTRTTAEQHLDAEAVGKLMQPVFQGARVTEFSYVAGGLANTNLRVRLSSQDKPVLLRLYQHNPAQARKEVAILGWVAGLVPVPAVLHFSEDNPITGNAYMVMEWIEGERLDVIAPTLDRDHLARLGHALGRTLAAIHGFSFERTGFLDGDLNVAEPVDLGRSGHLAFLEACLVAGRGAARLGADLTTELLAFVERRGGLLDTWLDAPCLIHSDFNGSNILVRQRPSDSEWEVAAVLDWEFAFSGSPAFDFGHVLRPPLGRLETLTDAIAKGYRKSGRRLPSNWRHIARIADLAAWAEFLDRPTAGTALIDDAREIIRDTIAMLDAGNGA